MSALQSGNSRARGGGARSNDIVCPKCGTRLEVASGSRTIASLAGLLAGAFAWKLSSEAPGDLGAVLPTLYAFLAFGIVSPLVLMFTANLRNAPAIPVAAPAHAADPQAARQATAAAITRTPSERAFAEPLQDLNCLCYNR